MPPRLIFAGVSVLLLCSASCSSPGSAETPDKAADSPPIVAVQRATFNNLSHSVALTAEFIPYQEIDVMAKIAGFVSKINVDIGDRVRTGQLLARLEVPEMSDDLTRAAATVERSDAEIKRAKDDVERAKAAHEIAHLSFERLQGVSKARPGLVAQQELDDARSKDLVSEAQVSAAQSAYVAAQQASAVNRAEQSRFRTLYRYTFVAAPFDGVVTKRYANTGSMIQAGTASQTQAMPIVRLSQNNLLRLMLPVPESDVPRIHLGQLVDVRVPALNRSFAGKVSRFTDKVTTSTRTMETEVDVPNPGLVLVPGMYAEVDLQLEERSHVLSIPVTAVDLTSPAPTVYCVSEDGLVSIVPVRLGMETSDRVEVAKGLKDGDMVVVGNRAGMKAGDKVRPKMVEIAEAKANS